MPLSKERMRKRKRLDRLVKPKSNLTVPVMPRPPYHIPEIDADGNPIPEYS